MLQACGSSRNGAPSLASPRAGKLRNDRVRGAEPRASDRKNPAAAASRHPRPFDLDPYPSATFPLPRTARSLRTDVLMGLASIEDGERAPQDCKGDPRRNRQLRPPAGAVVVDAHQRWLTPGVIDPPLMTVFFGPVTPATELDTRFHEIRRSEYAKRLGGSSSVCRSVVCAHSWAA